MLWIMNAIVFLLQVFLSARPHIYKDATESASFALFERLKSSRGMCFMCLLVFVIKLTSVFTHY